MNQLAPKHSICKQCSKEFKQTSKTYVKRYCSRSCSNTGRVCKKTTQSIETRRLKAKEYATRRRRVCKFCGCSVLRRAVCVGCKPYSRQINTLRYFGFNISTIKTAGFVSEVLRIHHYMTEEYMTGKSLNQICNEHAYPQVYALSVFYRRHLKVAIRGSRDAALLSIKRNGRPQPVNPASKYLHGWHTTYTGRKAYYRSSYELDYFKQLDAQQIDYQSEPFSVKYFDSQHDIERTAIPDVFIPSTNTIVEIKSTWTYNKQQMKDRFLAFRAAGYNTKLILNKQEVLV